MRLAYPNIDEAIALPASYATIFEDGTHYLIYKLPSPLRTPITPPVARLFNAYKIVHRSARLSAAQIKQLKRELATAKSLIP